MTREVRKSMDGRQPLPTRRRSVRVAVDLPAVIVCAATRAQGQVVNIGFGGAFVSTLERFAYGGQVDLWMPLLGPGTLSRLSSVIRWCDGSGFGVQFLVLGTREAQALSEFVLAGTLRRAPAKGHNRRLGTGMPR